MALAVTLAMHQQQQQRTPFRHQHQQQPAHTTTSFQTPSTSSVIHSLDANSTNPSAHVHQQTTRSINVPSMHMHACTLAAHSPRSPAAHFLAPAKDFALQPSPILTTSAPKECDFSLHAAITSALPAATKLATNPHSLTASITAPVFQSGLGASLAARKAQQQQQQSHQLASPSLSPPVVLPLIRHESVPSSCGSSTNQAGSLESAGYTSPLSAAHSPIHPAAPGLRASSPTTHPLAPSMANLPNLRRPVSLPLSLQPPPDPVTLWFGIEDRTHARAVLAVYETALQVQTKEIRQANSRAPLEFIGRVKRDRLDVAKLTRLVQQHKQRERAAAAAAASAPRQRYASAASSDRHGGGGGGGGFGLKGCDRTRRVSSSSPCLKRFLEDDAGSLASSPLGSSFQPPSALSRLPSVGAFATLDLVSIYSRDTLPLGLVFPLIRHVWTVSTWNVQDGVQETIELIKQEFEFPVDEDEEEEATPPDAEAEAKKGNKSTTAAKSKAKSTRGGFGHAADDDDDDGGAGAKDESQVALDLLTRAIIKRKMSDHTVNRAQSSVGPTKSAPSVPAATADSTSQQQQQQPGDHSHSSSSSSIASTASTPSSSSSGAVAPAVATATDPPLWHPAAPVPPAAPVDVPVSTYIYNLPMYEEGSDREDGRFDTFGCRHLRPLGDTLAFGPKAKKTPARKDPTTTSAAMPSAVGYAGAQNDCIYNCLQSLGRKVRTNEQSAAADDCCSRVTCAGITREMEQNALEGAAHVHCTPVSPSHDDEGATTPAHHHHGDHPPHHPHRDATETAGSSASESDSDSSSDSDGEEEEDTEDDGAEVSLSTDNLDDVGFEFGAADQDDDEDDDRDRRRHVSATIAIAGRATGRRAVAVDFSDDDDDDEAGRSFQASFNQPIAPGSLGDDLQAQLAALGLQRTKTR